MDGWLKLLYESSTPSTHTGLALKEARAQKPRARRHGVVRPILTVCDVCGGLKASRDVKEGGNHEFESRHQVDKDSHYAKYCTKEERES